MEILSFLNSATIRYFHQWPCLHESSAILPIKSLFHLSNRWKYIVYVHSFLVEEKRFPHWSCFCINSVPTIFTYLHQIQLSGSMSWFSDKHLYFGRTRNIFIKSHRFISYNKLTFLVEAEMISQVSMFAYCPKIWPGESNRYFRKFKYFRHCFNYVWLGVS